MGRLRANSSRLSCLTLQEMNNGAGLFKLPSEMAWPDFRAGTAEVAFESVELVHRGLEPGAANGLRR